MGLFCLHRWNSPGSFLQPLCIQNARFFHTRPSQGSLSFWKSRPVHWGVLWSFSRARIAWGFGQGRLAGSNPFGSPKVYFAQAHLYQCIGVLALKYWTRACWCTLVPCCSKGGKLSRSSTLNQGSSTWSSCWKSCNWDRSLHTEDWLWRNQRVLRLLVLSKPVLSADRTDWPMSLAKRCFRIMGKE